MSIGVMLVLAGLLVASLVLNAAFLTGGELAGRAALAFEAWTGAPAAPTLQARALEAAVEARNGAEAEVDRLHGAVSELSNTLLLARETNRSIRARYRVLSDELQGMRDALP